MQGLYRIFVLHVLCAGPAQERVRRSASKWKKRTRHTSVPISARHDPSKHESLIISGYSTVP